MRVFSPLLLLLLLLPGAPVLSGCDSGVAGCTSTDQFATEDITPEGTPPLGETAVAGSCVVVDYVGRLADGSGTFDEGTGLTFPVTSNSGTIAGFVLGVRDQQVGQTRRVTIPPNLAYGTRIQTAKPGTVGGVEGGEPYAAIPSCSTLEFDITLVRINQDARLCDRR